MAVIDAISSAIVVWRTDLRVVCGEARIVKSRRPTGGNETAKARPPR